MKSDITKQDMNNLAMLFNKCEVRPGRTLCNIKKKKLDGLRMLMKYIT